MADFKNCPISRIFGVFSSGFFAQKKLQYSCRIVFRMPLEFLIFDLNSPFSKGYSLCMGYSLYKVADFQNCLISLNICCFLERFFAQNNYNILVE